MTKVIETARQEFRRARKEELQRAGESRPAAEKRLEDIRVGDIMLCPDGEERAVNNVGMHVWLGDRYDSLRLSAEDLRNPEFRVGDTVRERKGVRVAVLAEAEADYLNSEVIWAQNFALVSRAAEKKPDDPSRTLKPWMVRADGSASRETFTGQRVATINPLSTEFGVLAAVGMCGWHKMKRPNLKDAMADADEWLLKDGYVEDALLAAKKPSMRVGPWHVNHEGNHVRDDGTSLYRAIVSRAGQYWEGIVSGTTSCVRMTEQSAKDWCDNELHADGWVLGVDEAVPGSDKTVVFSWAPRCTLCGHPGTRWHYAACEHNPEPKGSLITTLGWSQPAPIVVLAQNEEDVP